jgi:hypothetical protein
LGEKFPADFADFRRGIQTYLRLSAPSAGEKFPADFADFRRRIEDYLRSSASSAGEKMTADFLILQSINLSKY